MAGCEGAGGEPSPISGVFVGGGSPVAVAADVAVFRVDVLTICCGIVVSVAAVVGVAGSYRCVRSGSRRRVGVECEVGIRCISGGDRCIGTFG